MKQLKGQTKVTRAGLTRDELLTVAEKLFIKKGYTETSVNDIIRIAKISKGGFYHHFASKEALLSGIIECHLAAVQKSIEEIVNDKKMNAAKKLGFCFVEGWSFMRPKRKLFIDLLYNAHDPFINDGLCAKIKRSINPLFVKIVEQGVAEGALDCPYPAETIELIAEAKMALAKLPHETLHDKKKLIRYFAAFKYMAAKSLGVKNLKFDKKTDAAMIEHANFINKYHKEIK